MNKLNTFKDGHSFSSFSGLNSPREMMFIKVFVACPTAWEVFLAAPATTGCKETIGKLARSCIIAAIKHDEVRKLKEVFRREKSLSVYVQTVWRRARVPIRRIPASAAWTACADLLTPSAISWLNVTENKDHIR